MAETESATVRVWGVPRVREVPDWVAPRLAQLAWMEHGLLWCYVKWGKSPEVHGAQCALAWGASPEFATPASGADSTRGVRRTSALGWSTSLPEGSGIKDGNVNLSSVICELNVNLFTVAAPVCGFESGPRVGGTAETVGVWTAVAGWS